MKFSYTVALTLFFAGAVSAYPNEVGLPKLRYEQSRGVLKVDTSQTACPEADAFLAKPSKTTLAGLLEASDATCWDVIERSDAEGNQFKLDRLNHWVREGNPWTAQYSAVHLKKLDGAGLEDALEALGEFSDHDMEGLLILAHEGQLSKLELGDALTMLPYSLVDHMRAQLNYLKHRRARVNRVTRETLSAQKSVALKAIDQSIAEMKSDLSNNSQ